MGYTRIYPSAAAPDPPAGEPTPTGSGKYLYVAPSGGSDSTTRANNDLDHPWATVAFALLNAQAGDVVYFRGGTYAVSGNVNTASGADGTAANPIWFRAYPNETVQVNATTTGDSTFDIQQSYVYFYGLRVTSSGNYSNENGIVYVGDALTAQHVEFHYCTLTVGGFASNDNTHAIRFQTDRADGGVVNHCTLTGPGGSNGNGVLIFRSQVAVTNCDISGFYRGIYLKHSNSLTGLDGSTFARNYIHDVTGGTGIYGVPNYATIEHNLLVDCLINLGNDGGTGDGGIGGDYNTIRHNTMVGGSLWFLTHPDDGGCLHNDVLDNIFGTRCEWHRYGSVSADIGSDYNLYATSPGAVIENSTSYALAAWAAHNGSDAHSLAGAATFVGGDDPIRAYALAAGSLGKGAASDGSDMGATIALVGLDGEEA
jgi:hypothetical protein